MAKKKCKYMGLVRFFAYRVVNKIQTIDEVHPLIREYVREECKKQGYEV